MSQLPNMMGGIPPGVDPVAYMNFMAQLARYQQQGQGGQNNLLMQLLQNAQQQQFRANNQNDQRYLDILAGMGVTRDRVMGDVNQFGKSLTDDVNTQYERGLKNDLSSLSSRGLGGSTIRAGLTNTNNRERLAALTRVQDSLLNNRIGADERLSNNMFGLMERRNDIPPNVGDVTDLVYRLGQSGGGGMTGAVPSLPSGMMSGASASGNPGYNPNPLNIPQSMGTPGPTTTGGYNPNPQNIPRPMSGGPNPGAAPSPGIMSMAGDPMSLNRPQISFQQRIGAPHITAPAPAALPPTWNTSSDPGGDAIRAFQQQVQMLGGDISTSRPGAIVSNPKNPGDSSLPMQHVYSGYIPPAGTNIVQGRPQFGTPVGVPFGNGGYRSAPGYGGSPGYSDYRGGYGGYQPRPYARQGQPMLNTPKLRGGIRRGPQLPGMLPNLPPLGTPFGVGVGPIPFSALDQPYGYGIA